MRLLQEIGHASAASLTEAVFVAVSAAGAPRRYPSAQLAPGGELYAQQLEPTAQQAPVTSTRVQRVLTAFHHRVPL